MAIDGVTIVDQERDTDLNSYTNKIEYGWRVYWHDVKTGVSGNVFVPDSNYPAGADTIIKAQVDGVRQVHGLSE